jgi:hypothetical protein
VGLRLGGGGRRRWGRGAGGGLLEAPRGREHAGARAAPARAPRPAPSPHLVGLVELAAHVAAEEVPRAARAEAPALDVLRVTPQQVAHRAVVGHLWRGFGWGGRGGSGRGRPLVVRAGRAVFCRCRRPRPRQRPRLRRLSPPPPAQPPPPRRPHLLLAVYRADLVERRDGGRQAAVDAEDLVVNDGRQAGGRRGGGRGGSAGRPATCLRGRSGGPAPSPQPPASSPQPEGCLPLLPHAQPSRPFSPHAPAHLR